MVSPVLCVALPYCIRERKYKTMEKLTALFEKIFAGDNSGTADAYLKIIFSGKRRKSLEYSKVTLRPVILGGRLVCQAEYTFPKKVTHANLESEEAVKLALHLHVCLLFLTTKQKTILFPTAFHATFS